MHSLSDVFFRVAVAVAVGRSSKLTPLLNSVLLSPYS